MRGKLSAWILLLVISLSSGPAVAEVDQRPLNVEIKSAFPNLEWPEEVTGADSGVVKPLLPLDVMGARDGSGRLFVALQLGRIFHFENSSSASKVTKFLDISDRVHFNPNENEEGMLGIAFHPKFQENGQLFVYYTPKHQGGTDRSSVISRFRVSASDPTVADPASEEVLLTIPQPYWNHNGGTIVFGPDGFLYVGIGDGGLRNDPHSNGQNLQTLLGSIARIDVDGQTVLESGKALPYGIPADNPFVGKPSLARPEIWAYGLRNVWRMSFDRETQTCWAADVGQNKWEEINIISRGGNYGWNFREAGHAFGPGGGNQPPSELVEPIWEYGREFGKSITGGVVYRGKNVPELKGAYLYADYVSGHIWGLWYDEATEQVTANRTIREKGSPVMTFGEDDQGEVYFTSPRGAISTFASPSAN